ncbi:MAG: hypothetical protein ABL958_10030 [Bdellovibrionia bacterium]
MGRNKKESTFEPALIFLAGQVLAIAIVFLTGCSFQGLEVVKPDDGSMSAKYTPSNLTQALRSAANLLVMRLPTPTEYDEASKGLDGYTAVIQRYLTDPRFASPQIAGNPDPDIASQGGALLREHRNYFEMAGVQGTVNFNEPANIATFIVNNDRPYWETLTGNYCVDDNFVQTTPCSTFPDDATAAANSAGIITTRGFIIRNKSPFNFHIVNMAFQKFLCAQYPDATDTGMPKTTVSDRRKTFTSNSNGGMDCFFCHRSINPKAYLFFNYFANAGNDMSGRFTPDGLNSALNINTTQTDMGQRALPEDLLCVKDATGNCQTPSQVSVDVMGKPASSVRDVGKIMAQDPRFAKCATQHYVNWMFGLTYKTNLAVDMEYLVDVFMGDAATQPFNVKRLLLEITKSAKFVNR